MNRKKQLAEWTKAISMIMHAKTLDVFKASRINGTAVEGERIMFA